jgi:hypothetical protein
VNIVATKTVAVRTVTVKAAAMIAALLIGMAASRPAMADDTTAPTSDHAAKPERFCVQVISCGTKNGTVREYPTPCAAQDDGAANIAPKSGPTCGDTK